MAQDPCERTLSVPQYKLSAVRFCAGAGGGRGRGLAGHPAHGDGRQVGLPLHTPSPPPPPTTSSPPPPPPHLFPHPPPLPPGTSRQRVDADASEAARWLQDSFYRTELQVRWTGGRGGGGTGGAADDTAGDGAGDDPSCCPGGAVSDPRRHHEALRPRSYASDR